MTITLKSLRTRAASFDATVCVDGKRVGHVENDGRGGCNLYTFETPEGRAAFDAAVEAERATRENPGFEFADQLIQEAMRRYEDAREARKMLRKGYRAVIAVSLEPITIGDETVYMARAYIGSGDAERARVSAAAQFPGAPIETIAVDGVIA